MLKPRCFIGDFAVNQSVRCSSPNWGAKETVELPSPRLTAEVENRFVSDVAAYLRQTPSAFRLNVEYYRDCSCMTHYSERG
jgi:hypothetical protein